MSAAIDHAAILVIRYVTELTMITPCEPSAILNNAAAIALSHVDWLPPLPVAQLARLLTARQTIGWKRAR